MSPEEAVQQAREWLIARNPAPPKRPTIAELDAILASEDRTPVEINPDGTIGVHILEREAESHAAYSADRVRAELESLAKDCEATAKLGQPILSVIRARLALLKGEK